MSNVIPIVSSSPPPLDDDDDGDFKWDDDDDDEYGNFTCAPTVSSTTVSSESSVDVNWSNSKTAAPPHHDSSLGKETKKQVWREDLHISQSDTSTSEHTPIDNHNSVEGTENHFPDLNDDDVDFQDFARFDNIDFSEDPAKTLDETEDTQLDVPQEFRSPTAHTESPPADGDNVGSAAGLTQADEFQDFAQFNDDVTAESPNTSATTQPVFTDSSPDVSKLDTNSISSPYSTSDDVHSLGLDLSSESGAASSSVGQKNTDSVYSSVSTVDSGIFSTDLSPSLQVGEPSDVDLNIDKEERQTNSASVEPNSDTFPPSESSPGSLDHPASVEASEGHCQAAAAGLSNMIIEDDLDSKTVSDYSNISCDSDVSPHIDTASSSHAQVGYNNSDAADSMASVNNAELLIENLNHPGKEECDITDVQSGEQLEHSIQQKDQSIHSTLSTSDSAGGTGSDCPTDFVSSNVSLKPAAESDDVGDFQTAGGDTVQGAPSTVDVGDDLAEKFQTLNTDSVDTDVNIECNTERSGQSNIVGSAQSEFPGLAVDHEKPDSLSCDIKRDVSANSELLNEHAATCDLDSAADVGADKTFDKHHELQPEVGGEDSPEGEDAESGEFGDFSTFGCQKVEDSSEVVPIMFRTSICETEEGDDDDDDFAFNREKPPGFVDDDDDDFGEFGAAGVKSSDERTSNEIGECDQKVQPTRSKSDAYTDIKDNEEDDDDFGDFDHSEPVDEGTSWADFGSAPSHPTNSDSFSSSTTKPVVSNQSQVQKLQSVVISCFLGGSEDDSYVQQINTGQDSPSADNSHGGSSVLEGENPLPLDMVVDLGLSKALEAKQQTWTVVQHPSKKDPKVRLWAHLKDMDSSHALMYGWHSSHCSKEVYTSLHIDTQNILFSHKKQAVPFFASGLGILEPIRGGGVVERKKEKSSAPTTQNVLLDSGRQEYRNTPTVQDIPPVDFDWSSSGLTNPLTVFKAEDRVTVPSPSQPLEDILKRNTPTAKITTNEVLSAEAIRVLERMPDLSFMQSRVLMFPVKQ